MHTKSRDRGFLAVDSSESKYFAKTHAKKLKRPLLQRNLWRSYLGRLQPRYLLLFIFYNFCGVLTLQRNATPFFRISRPTNFLFTFTGFSMSLIAVVSNIVVTDGTPVYVWSYTQVCVRLILHRLMTYRPEATEIMWRAGDDCAQSSVVMLTTVIQTSGKKCFDKKAVSHRLGCGLGWVKGNVLDGWVHIGATWRIRQNRPYEAAMRPYVSQITLTTCYGRPM